MDWQKIHRLKIRTLRDIKNLLLGTYRSSFKGKGLEFEEVREYVAGDDVREIDWNVTAKTGTPYVKLFREERELTLFLVVDVSLSNQFAHTDQSKQQLLAEIGALLAFSANQNQDRVGLLLFSDRVELFLRPKKSLKHVLRIVRELLFFSPQGRGTDLGGALEFLGKVARKPTMCFLLSDFCVPIPQKELGVLAKKHELMAFQVTDSYERRLPPLDTFLVFRELESEVISFADTHSFNLVKRDEEQAQERQKALVASLHKQGVAHVEFMTGYPCLPKLVRFFQTRTGHFASNPRNDNRGHRR